ncbi:DNRLRE domain-containing protein [uncultured Clostridium sp.]|uniref:DNRLRE domain-containing protein n=1 Tax=uncultured Clostridium sp. TaxID=59620 RepID=UPI0025D349E2|nr:DNRLRE domain-containing protein [uncultured Clostridium sp.]
MGSILNFKSLTTTYVDSGHANDNFYECKNIYAGSCHKTPCSSIMYKSLIHFDLCSFEKRPLEYAYLCLYVKDINCDTSYYSNNTLSVYKNMSPYNPETVTWNTTPETDSVIRLSIPSSDIGNYIKINLTSIINSWIECGNNYGLTIEASNFYSSLVKFACADSTHPPIMFVEYKNPKFNYNFYNTYHSHSFR